MTPEIPETMLQAVTFDLEEDNRLRVARLHPVDESEDDEPSLPKRDLTSEQTGRSGTLTLMGRKYRPSRKEVVPMATRTRETELSDEARQAIAQAEAEENLEDIEADYAAVSEADPFSPESLSAPLAMPASLATRTAPTKGGRSEAQLAIDGVVETVHQAWVNAGRPPQWAGPDGMVAAGCVAGYWLAPAQVEKIRKMVKSAGDKANYAIRNGSPAPRTEDMPQDGKVFYAFCATDRRHREASV